MSDSGSGGDVRATVAVVRKEVAGLRDVIVAIQDALEQAVERLERLEGLEDGLGGDTGAADAGRASRDGEALSGATLRLRRGSRTLPPWKLPARLSEGGRAGYAAHGRHAPGPGTGAPAGAAGALGERAVTAESLRARRESLGISQAAVAHAAHCSRGLVAEVERGKRRSAQTLSHLDSTLDRLEAQGRARNGAE